MHVHDNESMYHHARVHLCNLVIIVVVRCSLCCLVLNCLKVFVQLVVVCMNNYMCRYILAVYIVVCYVLKSHLVLTGAIIAAERDVQCLHQIIV